MRGLYPIILLESSKDLLHIYCMLGTGNKMIEKLKVALTKTRDFFQKCNLDSLLEFHKGSDHLLQLVCLILSKEI